MNVDPALPEMALPTPVALPLGGLDEVVPPGTRRGLRGVLHVINGEHYSGAERVQDLLAARLPDFGFSAAFSCVKPDRFPRMPRSPRIPVLATPMNSRWDLRPARDIARLVRTGGYALLHAHTPRTAIVTAAAARLARVPWVYHVHSPASRDSTHRWWNYFNALVEYACLRSASAVIAVSGSLGERVRRWRSVADRVFVVPNGVPCQCPRPPRDPANPSWTLGTVALFRPRKGLEVLLESLAILVGQGERVRLRAVGDFETRDYRDHVLALAQKLGIADRIDWTGFTSDVPAELALIDVFVLPSRFGEGLPMVLLEAMAAGLPTVATRVEGIPEVIRDGHDGLLVEPDDARGLAAAIARFLHGQVDWTAIRAHALRRHAERFSDHAMAVGVAEVYRRVLPEPGLPA
jgi:glycosyltransferase involved in cell wall biosynthesis